MLNEYIIEIEKRAKKEFSKLSSVTQKQLIKAIENKIKNHPSTRGKMLKENLRGIYSCRVGKHRIVYELNETKRRVRIVGFKKRKYDYKDMGR